MAVILILILLLFLILYFLSREVWVIINSGERFEIQIHLPIFAVCLKNEKKGDNEKKSNQQELSAADYFRIISLILQRLKYYRLEVTKIRIPFSPDQLYKSLFSKAIGQQFLLFSLIAYLKTKSQKITIKDNAFILSPDVEKTQCYVTAKTVTYELIRALLTYKRCIKNKKKRQG